jgi:cobalt-zinc-cadmium efflux system outer membrane protein
MFAPLRRSAVLALFSVGIWASPVYGQSGPELTLADAINRVSQSHPRLLAQPYAVSGAAARSAQAGLRPALELGLDVENVLGSGEIRSFRAAEATLRLSTVLERGDKRAARVASATTERDLLRLTHEAERLDILAETARRFIAVLAAQENLRLSRESLALAQQTQAFIKSRVAQGAASPLERSTAALAAVQAEIDAAEKETAVRMASAHLAAMWGEAPEPEMTAAGALLALPALGEFEQLRAALERNPAIARLATERRVYEARVRLAEASAVPDVSVGLGVRRLEATNDIGVVLSAAVPLGSSARAAPATQEAQSRLQQNAFEAAAAKAELTNVLYGAHLQAEGARNAFERLQGDGIPLAEEAASQADQGYRAARFSLLELAAARQSLLALRLQAVAQASAYHNAVLEIERLTGEPLRLAGATTHDREAPHAPQ